MNDCFLYNKEDDPTISICLNCTRKKCTGNCRDVRCGKQDEKAWIVRAARTLENGGIKYGYIRSVTDKDFVQSVSKPDRLPAKTYSAAYYLKTRAEKLIKPNTILEIVRKDGELCIVT